MDWKTTLAVVAVIGLAGYAVGRYVQPARVEIKKEEVVKEVEVVKKDVTVVEREIRRPDGTVEIDRRTEDRSTETVDKSKQTKESTIVQNQKPQWKVSASATTAVGSLTSPSLVYGATVERRIIGPFFAGVRADTSKQVGLSVGMEF